jgi:hypothetical protein
VALSFVVAAGALAPAVAAPAKPKPITESYSVQHAPVPAPIEGVPGENSCDGTFEGLSTTTKTIKTVGAGTLDVELTGFAGDWDITVTDDKGRTLGIGTGTTTADPSSLGTGLKEKAVIKTKKPMTLNIAVCNFLGGPTADAKYTFVYK